jgi:hypothetical protein
MLLHEIHNFECISIFSNRCFEWVIGAGASVIKLTPCYSTSSFGRKGLLKTIKFE